MTQQLAITKKETVDKMIQSLKEELHRLHINEEDVRTRFRQTKDVHVLDEFDATGQMCYEFFIDIALDYARQFAAFGSVDFYKKLNSCVATAMAQF